MVAIYIASRSSDHWVTGLTRVLGSGVELRARQYLYFVILMCGGGGGGGGAAQVRKAAGAVR